MEYVLDAECMQTEEEAHNYLRKQLHLPEYYGENLDALYDCLPEMEDVEIVIQNFNKIKGSYAVRILQVIEDAEIPCYIEDL